MDDLLNGLLVPLAAVITFLWTLYQEWRFHKVVKPNI
jgi:hypothetical protein